MINFSRVDKNIYNTNSVFFSGNIGNTAIKAATCAVVIAGCSVSLYLIISGMPFPSTKTICGIVLASGTLVAGGGAVLWYRCKVYQIQKATRKLFDKTQENSEWNQMKSLLKENNIWLPEKRSQCFCDIEFIKRVQAILNNKDHLESNIDSLENLLQVYRFLATSEYVFLANQILKLDPETQKFILTHQSPKVSQLVSAMMTDIRYEMDTFVSFYTIIPETMRKDILISLGKSCFENQGHYTYKYPKHFAMALKHTPDLPRVLGEIRTENPSKAS